MPDCPMCNSEEGKYTDDPLKTPLHPIPEHRGSTMIRDRHITEIRENINSLELDYGVTETVWTPLTATLGRTKIINEMREALEAVIIAAGSTLEAFLSAGPGGTVLDPPITNWLDGTSGVSGYSGAGNKLLEGSLVRAQHLEQLRRTIPAELFDTIAIKSDYAWTNYNAVANKFPYGYSGTSGYSGSSGISGSGYFHGTRGIDPLEPYTSYPSPYNGYSQMFNNMEHFLYYEEETGIFYNFMGSYNTGIGVPMMSYLRGKNIDIDRWEGWQFEDNVSGYSPGIVERWGAKFDPELPWATYTTGDKLRLGCEGIDKCVIDTTGSDYKMYTIELFYSRAGGIATNPSFTDYYQYLRYGAPNYVARYTYPKQRTLGTSNGSPSQSFDASAEGIYIPLLDLSEAVYVGGVPWNRVADFTGSTSGSTDYKINNATGVVTFGDGVNGKIPQAGKTIVIFISLMGGGVWAYDKICSPRSSNNFHASLQIKAGTLWMQMRDKAFEGTEYINNGCFTSIAGGTYASGSGYNYWAGGDGGSIGGGTLLITGAFVLNNLGGYTGTKNKTILMNIGTGQTRPYVNNDNPEGWSVSLTLNTDRCNGVGPRWLSNQLNVHDDGWGIIPMIALYKDFENNHVRMALRGGNIKSTTTVLHSFMGLYSGDDRVPVVDIMTVAPASPPDKRWIYGNWDIWYDGNQSTYYFSHAGTTAGNLSLVWNVPPKSGRNIYKIMPGGQAGHSGYNYTVSIGQA